MLKHFLPFLCFLLLSVWGFTQDRELKYSENPDLFIEQLKADLRKTGVPDADAYAQAFAGRWKKNDFSLNDQTRIIQVINNMNIAGGFKTFPDYITFLKLYETVISKGNQIKVPVTDFFDVTDSCMYNQEAKDVINFFNLLGTVLPDGTFFKTSNSSWRTTAVEGVLAFNDLFDPGGSSHPKLVLNKARLIYQSDRDSTVVKETTGEFHLQARLFYGFGGKIDWSKVGLDPGVVYGDLGRYALNLNYSKVEFDSVTFHYKSLFKQPIKGKVTDINMGVYDPDKAQYPMFEGYEGGVIIDRFIPAVIYEGGFKLRGTQKVGCGYLKTVSMVPDEPEKKEEKETIEEGDSYFTETAAVSFPLTYEIYQKASISILDQKNRIRVKIFSDEFLLNPDKLTSKLAEWVIYIGKEDSLSHPGMNVQYDAANTFLQLYKDPTNPLSRQPIRNSYTGYNIYTESLKWNVRKDTVINFTAIIDKENKMGGFESDDYFNKKRFDQFRGVLGFHPVGAIYGFTLKYPGTPILVDAVLEMIKKQKMRDGFFQALKDLEGSGFVKYDPVTYEIIPLPKLFHWTKAARGKKDYDNLLFLSSVEDGNYANLNLNDLMMDVNGVVVLNFSDTQYVRAVTQDREITLLEDRDILFNGAIAAGKINLIGSSRRNMFRFDYGGFRIECDSIDSLRFILKRELKINDSFSPLQTALRNTTFEGVKGAILIDRPENKSSRKKSPNYSAFDSYSESFVYWERPEIYNSIYERKKLYFSLYPFLLDSLEDFDEKDLRFEGKFFSSEIFPLFEQYLQPMKDNTMGIVERTPEEGYDIYEGKAKYFDEINMDGFGLHGKGKLDYLATTALSDTFRFFFDTVTAYVKTFSQKEGRFGEGYFPAIEAKNIDYKWHTKLDVLEIQTTDKPMAMFGGRGIYEGKLRITPEGMRGSGKLKLDLVTIISEDINFTEEGVDAKKGFFSVTDAESPDKLQMEARDVELTYSLKTDVCDFITGVEGKPLIRFHEQNYEATLGKGKYNKATNDVKLFAMAKNADDDYFRSTSTIVDSLTLIAKESDFNFKERVLKIRGVPYVDVADARVIPDSLAEIRINREGIISPMSNAIIFADRDSVQHKIYDATVSLISKSNYTGSGRYDYIKVDGIQMFINFEQIGVENGITHAKGVIRETQKFYITDRILFDGTVDLYGNNKFMTFSGNVRIQSKNPVFANKPFEFSDVVDPENIFIPVTEEKMGKLVLGVYFNPMYRNFNSRFLQEKVDVKDKEIFSAKKGKVGLTFDRERQEFRIGLREKFSEEAYKGNQISLNDNTNLITAEGAYSFPYQFVNGLAEIKVSGKWAEQGKNNISTDMLWAFDFKPIPKKAMEELADDFGTLFNLSLDLDYENRFTRECIAEILDENEAGEKNTTLFVKELESGGIMSNIELAKRMPYTTTMTGLKFAFNDKLKTLAYAGEAGVIGFGPRKVNKILNTYIEYEFGKGMAQGRENDKIRIYIEIDDMNWVYFAISGEVIKTTSTSSAYQDAIRAEADKAKGKGNRCELADDGDVTDFIQQFKTRHSK
jgi:hypothetical protein